MKDWTGTTIRSEAQRVVCDYCHAAIGSPCHTKGDPSHPLEAFPAHEVRIRKSKPGVS